MSLVYFRKTVFPAIAMLSCLAFAPAQAASNNVFISEYIEGSSYNKALEIYNGTGGVLDLASYTVAIYHNGATTASSLIDLSGTLAAGDVFVIAHDSADAAVLQVANQIDGKLDFNGDDTVILWWGYNINVMDSIGQLGVDPGTEWWVAGVGTQDESLTRKPTICTGDSNELDPFDPSLEWTTAPADTFDGLGWHTAICDAPPPASLLLSEVVVTPTGAEFIELHNPTDSTISLDRVYLTDATYAPGGLYYYNIVQGMNAGGGAFADFHARFPNGAAIPAGGYQTVSLAGSLAFLQTYGTLPTYELYEDDAAPDGVPDMREALPGSINDQGGLTNDGEVAILYYWDGAADLVADLDYAVWGDKAEAVDKTGVAIDGPDPDATPGAYLDDTPIASQAVVSPFSHLAGSSWQRIDLAEGSEIPTGGNGIDGNDETSEDLDSTWCEQATATPNMAAGSCILPEPAEYPADFTATALSDHQISTTWTDAGGDPMPDGYLVLCATASSLALPVDGYPQPDDPACADGNGAINVPQGSGSTAGWSGLAAGPQYFFRIHPYTNAGAWIDYKTDGTPPAASATTAPPPPVYCAVGDGVDTCIHDIQGAGASSPLFGSTVTIEAIVVGDFQQADQLGGFFVQEEDAETDPDPLTSEGLFVYCADCPVAVTLGDRVRVTGTVNEYYGSTEISPLASLAVVSSDHAPPTPAEILLPLPTADALEPFEGMAVIAPQTLFVTAVDLLGRGGLVTLSADDRLPQPTQVAAPGSAAIAVAAANDRNRIILDDGSLRQNPEPILFSSSPPVPLGAANTLRGGDRVTGVRGVLGYGWSGWSGSDNAYRIHATLPPPFTAANPRPATAPDLGGTLRVAAFNLRNYFTTLDTGLPVCGPVGYEQLCRGADSAAELVRQQDKLVAALTTLDADIIGLLELENTGQNAVADLAARLPGYAYIANPAGPGAELGTDVITAGILYRSASVTPVGAAATVPDGFGTDLGTSCGTAADDIAPFDRWNRKPLAQTFRDAAGERFSVVINHFLARSAVTGYALDEDQGDGQGMGNCTRTQAMLTLLDWLAADPTASGDPDVLILGDLNAYAQEDPLQAAAAAGFSSLSGDYSYQYAAAWGALDHALASPGLLYQLTGAAAWHVNADEPSVLDYNEEFKSTTQLVDLYAPDVYRSSDHDPVVVGGTLGSAGDTCFAGPVILGPRVMTGTETHESMTTIETSGAVVVASSADITFAAPLAIHLQPGFRVEHLGRFSARIMPVDCQEP